MKLQRWSRHNGDYVKTTNGPWVLAADAKALEKRVEELEKALREIGDFDCECFEDDNCAVCLARLALEEKK